MPVEVAVFRNIGVKATMDDENDQATNLPTSFA